MLIKYGDTNQDVYGALIRHCDKKSTKEDRELLAEFKFITNTRSNSAITELGKSALLNYPMRLQE
mgnify:CR=1 FL=1